MYKLRLPLFNPVQFLIKLKNKDYNLYSTLFFSSFITKLLECTKFYLFRNFRTNTSELVAVTQPGSPQAGVRSLPGATVIAGGVMVEAAGSLVGAIGVSGAPGGEFDEACSKAGIAAVRDKLDF